MLICLDEGLLPGSRMTIDQVCVDNKALTQTCRGVRKGTKGSEQFVSAREFAPPHD